MVSVAEGRRSGKYAILVEKIDEYKIGVPVAIYMKAMGYDICCICVDEIEQPLKGELYVGLILCLSQDCAYEVDWFAILRNYTFNSKSYLYLCVFDNASVPFSLTGKFITKKIRCYSYLNIVTSCTEEFQIRSPFRLLTHLHDSPPYELSQIKLLDYHVLSTLASDYYHTGFVTNTLTIFDEMLEDERITESQLSECLVTLRNAGLIMMSVEDMMINKKTTLSVTPMGFEYFCWNEGLVTYDDFVRVARYIVDECDANSRNIAIALQLSPLVTSFILKILADRYYIKIEHSINGGLSVMDISESLRSRVKDEK